MSSPSDKRAADSLRRGEQSAGRPAAATADVTVLDPAAMGVFVDSIKDYAIFALDRSGRVSSWNAGAERIQGYQAGEILGQHISVFHVPEELERGRPAELLRLAATEGRIEDEGLRVRKDG
ncbi:MAG TPA: PAS domain-containing protein, partial [Candidatus Binataceae bacterium]|nr:PAS domain-containing protein [Candidatus Binataceae bacterium]